MCQIKATDLKSGDILLYEGTSVFAWLIQKLDGTTVNHASIYLKPGDRLHDELAEACADGLQIVCRNTSFADATQLQVRRLPGGLSLEPVVEEAKRMVADVHQYAYAEIVTIAAITLMRQLPLPSYLKVLVPPVLRVATNLLETWLSHGHKPLICSEFVWLCYENAGPGYHLQYDRQAAVAAGMGGILNAAPAKPALAMATEAAPSAPATPAELKAMVAELQELVAAAKTIDDAGGARYSGCAVLAPADVKVELTPMASAFVRSAAALQATRTPVAAGGLAAAPAPINIWQAMAAWPTPGDLLVSSSLETVGTLPASA